ncbi:MAG: chloride channel protein [Chloroflexota bacterium]
MNTPVAVSETASLRSWRGLRDWLLADYLRKWVFLGVLIGIVAGLGAIVFYEAIAQFTKLFLGDIAGVYPPSPRGEGDTVVTAIERRWAIPFVLVIGGLISGVIVFWLAPEAEGHGTDAAIEAFHERGGKIRPIIPPVKILASAITIGSGGSAGREGPTAQIAAGFGSILGDVFHLSSQDRRIAVAVGVGAGIGAIFKAPLGGAVLAAEILYIRDFEVEALIPGFIASVIGYCVFATYSGWTPVFGDVADLKFDRPESLVWYAAMGVAAGLVGIGYVKAFYGTRDLFHKIHIPPHFKPAIGALGVGLIGLAFPETLSMGYGWLQLGIEGDKAQLAIGTMVALIGIKIIATSLTIGSGGSGGVFAPGLFIGGMLGGSMWWSLHSAHIGWIPDQPAPFVIVGMMALFGGVAKAPIAVMLMVAEMTGEFSMIVPAMIACTIAYLVTGNITIYENQVESRAKSPAHRAEFTIPLVQRITVGDAMKSVRIWVGPNETIEAAEALMEANDVRSVTVIEEGKLIGMFSGTDVWRAKSNGTSRVGAAMSKDVILAYPADNLHTALQRMARAGVSRLPVVQREKPDRVIGLVSMRDIGAVLDLEMSALATAQTRVAATAASDDPLQSVLVREAMRRKFETVPESLSIKKVANRLAVAIAHAALVVGDDGELKGIVTLSDLTRAADDGPDRPVSVIATKRVIVTRPDRSVSETLAQPGAEELRQIPVVEQQNGHSIPIGILNRSDVVAAYLRSRDRQAQIARRARSVERDNSDGVARLDLLVTPGNRAAGRTLAELGLPTNAVITAILREGKVLVPRGQLRVESGDHVQVLVAVEARDSVVEAISGTKRVPSG